MYAYHIEILIFKKYFIHTACCYKANIIQTVSHLSSTADVKTDSV